MDFYLPNRSRPSCHRSQNIYFPLDFSPNITTKDINNLFVFLINLLFIYFLEYLMIIIRDYNYVFRLSLMLE